MNRIASEELERLKKQLVNEVNKDSVDIGNLYDLLADISKFDPENVYFSIDSGHINKIGRELVQKQETAVSELIKNAYDADATTVKVHFINTQTAGGAVVISDNGHGMRREDIINGFMRLSTRDKIDNPVSPLYKRDRAGKKGIGRFAAQRLGEKLTIITKTANAEGALRVEIDWRDYGDGGRELAGIANRIVDEKNIYTKGTTLIIGNLRESWPESAIRRVFTYVQELIQPFPLSKTPEEEPRVDPGFKVEMDLSISGEEKKIADVETLVYEYALAEIDAFVEKGVGYWTLKSDKFDITEEFVPIEEASNNSFEFDKLNSVYLKAYYYIYSSDLIPKAQLVRLQKLGREKGGIRVYKNGFRVLPYGEPDDDWLGLDFESERRSILVPIANRNFLGFVEIADKYELDFRETSSREGLVRGTALDQLIRFCSAVLIKTALRIGEERNRKLRPTKVEKSVTERLKSVLKNAEKLVNSLLSQTENLQSKVESKQSVASDEFNALNQFASELQNVVNSIRQVSEQQEHEAARLLEETELLRVVSGLGLVIAEFTHEVRTRLESINIDLDSPMNPDNETDCHKKMERLRGNFGSLRFYTAYFNSAMSSIVNREISPQNIKDVLRNFETKALKVMAKKEGIEIEPIEYIGSVLFTKPMHQSEWASILMNLYTNSKKAIERAGTKGRIKIRAGRDGSNIFLEFSDNGDGVKPENEERIFDAFFTSSNPTSPLKTSRNIDLDIDIYTGMGLGLKIVKDIILSYEGNISLVGASTGYTTCFRVEIPAASEEELDQYGL